MTVTTFILLVIVIGTVTGFAGPAIVAWLDRRDSRKDAR